MSHILQIIKNIINYILRLGISQGDSEALQLKKISITMVPVIIGPVGFIWSLIYFELGQVIPASIPMFYTFSSIITVLIFSKTKDIVFIQKAQMTLILFLPFMLMWSLGGFSQSSYIFIWAFFAPITALIHEKGPKSLYWLYSFIGLVILSALADQWLMETIEIQMSSISIEIFFILNISIALSGIYFLIRYFTEEKDKNTDEQLRIEHDALLEKTDELQKLLYTDNLTNLKNRNALHNDIYTQEKRSCILINIDNFSHINNLYGEKFGNRVLKEFAHSLDSFYKKEKNSTLYRFSGDEFALISKELRIEKLLAKAKAFQQRCTKSSIIIEDQEISLNVTIAISREKNSHLISTANMAISAARKEFKSLMLYTDALSLNSEYENNIKWIKEIKSAIAEDRITMFFQPIIDNEDPSRKKFETLIRLIDKEGNVVVPYHFLEIAKKAKLYKQLTKIVLTKSFEAFKDNDYEFSVNITIDDILDPDITAFIIATLKKYKISKRVIFEIVESESIENFDQVEEFIVMIKKYGCRISIDDFGTGYSNFEHLMRLQADFIKIDGSIIKEITHDKRSALITSVIVAFAKEMNIQTIGEFVETKEINDKLISLGVNKSQGYYFDKPLPTLNGQ